MQSVTGTGNNLPSIKNFRSDNDFLMIEWSSGDFSKFPLLYLLDNAPGARHANGQKLDDTSSMQLPVRLEKIWLNNAGSLIIQWGNEVGEREYPAEWFIAHELPLSIPIFTGTALPEIYAQTHWNHEKNKTLSGLRFSTVSVNDHALLEFLGSISKYGFAMLKHIPPVDGFVLEVTGLFGYTRETNYGKLFNVKTVVNPANLAYTFLGIKPHTDNPYRNPVPGLQLLHCLASSAAGGETVLLDGFAVAEDLRKQRPGYFNLLSSVNVTFQYRDENNWLEYSSPIINLYPTGALQAIRFNNRSMQPLRLPPLEMPAFYEAYVWFAKMLEDRHYHVNFKMAPGDLYVVDNERILHARTAFNNRKVSDG